MKTNTARFLSYGLTLALMATFLLAFTPSASAQTTGSSTKVEVADPDPSGLNNGRLTPESGLAKSKITVTVTVQNTGSACISPVNVKYTFLKQQSWQTVVVTPQTDGATFTGKAAGVADPSVPQTITFIATLFVSTTRDAPAFQAASYTVQADVTFTQAQSGCNIPGSTGVGSTTINNDYIPLTQIVPGTYFVKAGQNSKVTFPIDVSNLGNGPSRIKVSVAQTGKNKLDSVIPPADLHLESRATKGAAALFKQPTKIDTQTPHSNGYTNSIYTFAATFTTTYDGAGGQGSTTDEATVTLSVQVQGVYVPGFDSVSLIAGLGVALLAFGAIRRRGA